MISILATHYEGSTTKDQYEQFIWSLLDQSRNDFELIVMHDGLTKLDYKDVHRHIDFKFTFKETKQRANKWGHNLRDEMLRMAQYDWILHTNTDNLYEENAVEIILDVIDTFHSCPMHIFDVLMQGLIEVNNIKCYLKDDQGNRNNKVLYRLQGIPCVQGNVDCMQVLTHKSLWKDGWYDYSECSDGIIYEQFARDNFSMKHDLIIGTHR